MNRNPFARYITARSIAPHKSPRRVNHPVFVLSGHTSARQRAATMPGASSLIGVTKAPSRSRIRWATFSATVEPKVMAAPLHTIREGPFGRFARPGLRSPALRRVSPRAYVADCEPNQIGRAHV